MLLQFKATGVLAASYKIGEEQAKVSWSSGHSNGPNLGL